MPKSKMDKIVRITDIHLIPMGAYQMEDGEAVEDAWMVAWKDEGQYTFKVVGSRQEAETLKNYLEVLDRAMEPGLSRADERRAMRSIKDLQRALKQYEKPTRVRRHLRRI